MKKTNFSKFLVFLLVVAMACSMVILTACDNTNPHKNVPNKTGEDSQIVKNGDFTFTTGDDYPRTPNNWSGSIAGSGSDQPAGGLEAIKSGVINVGNDYEAYKGQWGNLDNPTKHDDKADDNILMIYNSTPSSYSYSYSNVVVEANKHYKLSFYVKTAKLDGEKENGTLKNGVSFGAYAKIEGGYVRGEWMDINTNETWQKYDMYIEGGNSDSTLSIQFGLGYGYSYQKHLTQGYAFFDDVTLEEVDSATYASIKDNDTNNVRKDSFKISNANFVSRNKYYKELPYDPVGWSQGYGGVGGDAANTIPTSDQASIIRGVVDFGSLDNNKTKYGFQSDQDLSKLGFNLREGAIDNYALLLQANKDYSINYTSNSKILVKKGKTYQIGVWVKTFDTVADKTAKGSVILSNDDEKYTITFDKDKVYTNGDTEGKPIENKDAKGWHKVVFNIRGNSTHDVVYNLKFALGTGGKTDKEKTWSCGHVLFDDVTIIENDSKAVLNAWALTNDKNNLDIDLNKDDNGYITNMVENGNFTADTAKDNVVTEFITLPEHFAVKDVATSDSAKFTGGISYNVSTDLPFKVIYKFDDTTAKYADKRLEFSATKPSTITLEYVPTEGKQLTAVMNKYYRLSFLVKTEDMAKTAGMNFTLNIYDNEGKEVVQTATIDTVNSANTKVENGWQEVVFFIGGEATMDRKFGFEMSFGKGDMFDQTISSGKAYIYNINCQSIDRSAYSNASSSNLTKKVDIASTNAPREDIANGFFNKIDNSSSSFDKETGKLDKFGVPQSWSNESVNDEVKKYETNEPKDPAKPDGDKKKETIEVKKGILDLTNTPKIFENDKIENAPIAPSITPDVLNKLSNNGENKYALAIYSSRDTIAGYKSNYISLSANSFYSIRVKAYSTDNTTATVQLVSSAPHEENLNDKDVDIHVLNKNGQTGFTEYVFYVKTGQSSASVQLVLTLGNNNENRKDSTHKAGTSKGLVVFDDAIMIKHSSEASYNKFRDDDTTAKKEIEFNVDGFATNSYDNETLVSPNGWNMAEVTSPNKIGDRESATKAGIINLSNGKLDKIWDYNEAGEKTGDNYVAFQNKKDALLKEIVKESNGYKPEFGSSVLMIDNMKENGYSVTNSSISMSAKKYYKISMWIYTANIEGENGLTLKLKLGNRAQDTVEIANIQTTNKWQQYTFYVSNINENASTINASFVLQLGTRQKEGNTDTLKAVKGTVFADNFKVEEIKKADYDTAVQGDVVNKPSNNAKIDYEPEKSVKPDEDKKEEEETNTKKPVDWTMLSWAIPTIVLAVILIAVLGVFLYKKYSNPKNTKFKNKPKKPRKEVTKNDNFDEFND